MRIEKKLIRMVLLLAVTLLVFQQLCAEETAAREADSGDVFWLSDVCTCPGDSLNEGQLRGTVYWYGPEPPYPWHYGVGYLCFEWAYSGPIHFDSVTIASPLSDTLSFTSWFVDSIGGELDVCLDAESAPGDIVTCGTRRVLNLYFTTSDTGEVAISQLRNVYLAPLGYLFNWDGYFEPSQFALHQSGDFDGNGVAGNISDAVFLMQFIFGGEDQGQSIIPLADTNNDCIINITDVVYIIAYIFAGGPTPGLGCH